MEVIRYKDLGIDGKIILK